MIDPEPHVLLEGRFGRSPELYRHPLALIRADEAGEVAGALAALDAALERGRHVAGFLAYELGYALEPCLAGLMPDKRAVPLIWLGVFGPPERPGGDAGHPVEPLRGASASITPEAYAARVARILDYIQAGDIYQANFTYLAGYEPPRDPYALYRALKANQPVPYPALVATGAAEILSLSPELFFRIAGRRILAQPMKGTAPRAADAGADASAARALRLDEKNRAENLMIVDLMRNDLSRIAKIGSVRVPRLFSVETYRTLHTMTSTIEAELRDDVAASDIIRAMFPSGSVTGAPKIRAMEIIRELEDRPRGVYCGAIGVFRPDGTACFNVAIRTLTIARGTASLGVGGAIVADSNVDSEFAETQLKRSFLTLPGHAADQAPLRLIETMRWTPDTGITLLALHLARAARSARYFGFDFDSGAARAAIAARAAAYSSDMRVRLLIAENGAFDISETALAPQENSYRYVVSTTRIKSDDPFRAHKTTRRGLYDEEHAALSRETGCDEVIYLNERGELAEGSRMTIFVRRRGMLLTPPLASGALPGVLRQSLIDAGHAREAVLTLADLASGDEVVLGNAVRGLVPALPLVAQLSTANAS